MADSTSAPPYEITVGGPIDDSDFQSFVVERDMFQPDMASIVLANQAGAYSTALHVGAPVVIKVGDDKKTIYEGEIVGLEATYQGGEKTRLLVRAMNKMHRLMRHRKSLTFTDKNDQQILSQVAQDAGLTLEWKGPSITYKHVYQHNQTDLEFVRMRAARVGCHVWCVGTKLYVKEPDLQQQPAKQLKIQQEGGDEGTTAIKRFTPRINSAHVVKKVTVKGWNPEKKELLTGVHSAQSSKLGKQNAVAASGDLGKEETFNVDTPIWSNEEATALAKARLVDASLSFITGECEVTGDNALDIGQVVYIEANSEPDAVAEDLFNGGYYIMGVTHRYVLSKSKDGGYTTILRLARDAAKKA